MEHYCNNQWLFKPDLLLQLDLWGKGDYLPVLNKKSDKKFIITCNGHSETKQECVSLGCRNIQDYLHKNLLTDSFVTEGPEEIPCVQPYTQSLPRDIVAMDERVPQDCSQLGLHGFCYDYILEQKLNNWNRVINKAKKFHCAFGPNFSVLMDGLRCEAIEAIRRNRIATISLQQAGIPTIQTVSLTCARFFDIAYDGLAPNCPVAFEYMCKYNDKQLLYLLRLSVEKLLEIKNPTTLIIVGNRLDFDPGIPVVYYKSRIQKIREHEYSR